MCLVCAPSVHCLHIQYVFVWACCVLYAVARIVDVHALLSCEHALLCMCILYFVCASSVLYAYDPLCMRRLFSYAHDMFNMRTVNKYFVGARHVPVARSTQTPARPLSFFEKLELRLEWVVPATDNDPESDSTVQVRVRSGRDGISVSSASRVPCTNVF